MDFYGLVEADVNGVVDKTVPLVHYDKNDKRHVIGECFVSQLEPNGYACLRIKGTLTDLNMKSLFAVRKEFSFQPQQPKETKMEFTSFVRRPFIVTAIQITAENIDELAPLVGEVKEGENGKYIALDRRIIPNIRKAFIGWWITKLDDNVRCYSPKVFDQEFTQYEDAWAGWFETTTEVEDMLPPVDESAHGTLVVDL